MSGAEYDADSADVTFNGASLRPCAWPVVEVPHG
jgi:hypothetical protein